jgi:putative transposase
MKTVKQYSKPLNRITQIEFESKAIQTSKLMNWVYTQFNGVKSYYLIQTSRPTYLRDNVLGKDVCSRFNLQTRSTSNAIRDAIANLKTVWTNIFNEIREKVNYRIHNCFMNDQESHYVRTVLKYAELSHCILNNWKFENFPYKSEKRKKFILSLPGIKPDKTVNKKKLDSWIRREIRKLKIVPKIKNSRQFPVERYSRKSHRLSVEGLNPGKTPKIFLTDSRPLKPSRIVLKGNKVEVHCNCKIKANKSPTTTNEVGVDKGYRNLLATSSENLYGKGFGDIISRQVDKQVNKGRKRNKLRDLAEKRENQGRLETAENIRKHNLGSKKFLKRKGREDETIKNLINSSLNQFFKTEKPTSLVYENLTNLEQRKDNKYSRKTRNKLNKWRKGYLQERLTFKSIQNGCGQTAVNPAYTSQECSICGRLGSRQGDTFTCKCTREQHADINASKNILARKYDSEIGLYTPYKKVKEILLARIDSKSDQVEFYTYSWSSKTLETEVGEQSIDYTVTQRANSKSLSKVEVLDKKQS